MFGILLRGATPNQQLWLMDKLLLNLKPNGLRMRSMTPIVITRLWMEYTMEFLLKSSVGFPLVKLQKKHEKSYRQCIRVQTRWSNLNCKGWLKNLKPSWWKKMRPLMNSMLSWMIVNFVFILGEEIQENKIVKKILRSLPSRFHSKVDAIEENKNLNTLKVNQLDGNL